MVYSSKYYWPSTSLWCQGSACLGPDCCPNAYPSPHKVETSSNSFRQCPTRPHGSRPRHHPWLVSSHPWSHSRRGPRSPYSDLSRAFGLELECMPLEIFWACPTGRKPWGRPRTHWRDYFNLFGNTFGSPWRNCKTLLGRGTSELLWLTWCHHDLGLVLCTCHLGARSSLNVNTCVSLDGTHGNFR